MDSRVSSTFYLIIFMLNFSHQTKVKIIFDLFDANIFLLINVVTWVLHC